MGPMDQFIRAQNVRRYRNLLQRTAEEADRKKLLTLLTEEKQKQKDAGDDGEVRPRFPFSNQGGEL